MPSLIVRWWRWFTNPAPMPGEVWQVDGIGPVEIVCGLDSGFRYFQPSPIEFKTQGGERLTWAAGGFLSRSRPGAPDALLALRDTSGAPRPTPSGAPRLIAPEGAGYGKPRTMASPGFLEAWLDRQEETNGGGSWTEEDVEFVAGLRARARDLSTPEPRTINPFLPDRDIHEIGEGFVDSFASAGKPTTPPPRDPPPMRPRSGGYQPDPATAPCNPRPPPASSGVKRPRRVIEVRHTVNPPQERDP